MGRKRNSYGFEKRQKELKKQKKREEKLAKKLEKGDEDDAVVGDGVTAEAPDVAPRETLDNAPAAAV